MDAIYKFQSHRTMHLQGFDSFGASAALWGASDTGFSVSGVFRDQGDFAVLLLFQKGKENYTHYLQIHPVSGRRRSARLSTLTRNLLGLTVMRPSCGRSRPSRHRYSWRSKRWHEAWLIWPPRLTRPEGSVFVTRQYS